VSVHAPLLKSFSVCVVVFLAASSCAQWTQPKLKGEYYGEVRKISKKELLIKGTNIFHNKFDRTTVSMWVIIILQKLYFRVLSKS
jgi:hypothetical protein